MDKPKKKRQRRISYFLVDIKKEFTSKAEAEKYLTDNSSKPPATLVKGVEVNTVVEPSVKIK